MRAENVHGRSEPSLCSDNITINEHHGSSNDNQMQSPEIDVNDDNVDGHDEVNIRQGGDFKSRFLVEEELGKGRFGVVHRVVEHETGRVLAAKTVKCIKSKDKVKVIYRSAVQYQYLKKWGYKR